MPRYVTAGHETLPFCIPFRSLTNERYGNLLVAGKTMAQSFLANAATRLHPIEWSTGTAAGVAAAAMNRNDWDTRKAFERVAEIQALVRRRPRSTGPSTARPTPGRARRRPCNPAAPAGREEGDQAVQCGSGGEKGGGIWPSPRSPALSVGRSVGCQAGRGRYTTSHAPVAQLDRVADFESEGCRFDSYRARFRGYRPGRAANRLAERDHVR